MRILGNIEKYSSDIRRLLESADDPHQIYSAAVMKYGITQTFIESWDGFKARLERIREQYADYIVLPADEIFDTIRRQKK